MTRNLARSAFFLSGVAGLTFEIVWMRHLGWAVGGTTLAVATTTAAYMGGLALGSHLGGRIADRLRRPLAVYGLLEIGLALAGILIPSLCAWVPQVAELALADASSGVTRGVARFLVALAVLLVPTTAMGMTLPVLARAVTDRVGQVGRQVGTLYALNIGGAMVGAGLAGFWWIPTVGLLATNWVAVGLDLGLGAVALAVGLTMTRPLTPTPAESGAALLRPGSRPLIAMLVVTGGAAMALQVLWTRAIGTALGPSTYAFSAIVCTYLAGLAAGGGVAARIADRVPRVRLALAVVLVATGGFALVGIVLVDDLPLLLQKVVLDPDLTVAGLFRAEFALAALAVLPATAGMGAIFPLTLSAVAGSYARLGGAVGRAYALNTVGNILGSSSAVFVLLPLFGVEWGMRVAAISYPLAAGFILFRVEPSVAKRLRAVTAAAAAVTLAALLLWPSWVVAQWTSGMFRMSMTRYYYSSGGFQADDPIFHRDGLSTTVTVEEENGVRWIKVNGKIDGSSHGDMPTQVLSGVLPMLFREPPREVAVIGCGSGVTVGAALQSDPEHLTLIEIESAVIEAAHLFEDVNHAPWDDPRVTIVEDDGRNFLSRPGTTYDVIISEPSNPWMTGASSLFTVEFFEIARRRLAEDGTFLQWLQTYELAPERIASVLLTFQSVFPHVIAFTPQADSNDLLILGRNQPWELHWDSISHRFEQLRGEMERAGLESRDDLLALLLFTDAELAKLDPAVPLNTDDNAFVEFGAPRDLLAFAEDDPNVVILDSIIGGRARILRGLSPEEGVDWSSRFANLAIAYLRQGFLTDSLAAARLVVTSDDASREIAAQVGELVELFEEEDRERVVDGNTARADPKYALLANLVLRGETERALEEMDADPDLKFQSGAHALLYGFLCYHEGYYSSARRFLLRARSDEAMQRHRPAIAYYLAKESFEAGEYDRAVEEMTEYRESAKRRLSPSPTPE
jgi:spermidine synthase